MAWVFGYSEEPQDSSYVDIYKESAVKVYAICQDLVYNNIKGRTLTPKSLALVIAVRQLSGCSGLINMLNSLGHCVSLSSPMAYDSYSLVGALSEVSTNFSVQCQNTYGFLAVACDQTIEQTANRGSKTKGGLIGFTMNRASVDSYSPNPKELQS